jgi:hypothetical protein
VDVVVDTPAGGDVTAVLVHAALPGSVLSTGALAASVRCFRLRAEPCYSHLTYARLLQESATCGSTHIALHVPISAQGTSSVVTLTAPPPLIGGQAPVASAVTAWYQVGDSTWVGPATWCAPGQDAAGVISRRALLQDATPATPAAEPVSSSEGDSSSSDVALGPSSSTSTAESGEHMYSDSETSSSSEGGTDWSQYNGTSTSTDYFPSSTDYAEEAVLEAEMEQMLANSTNVTATPATPAATPAATADANVTAPGQTKEKDAAAAAAAHPPPAAVVKPAAPMDSTTTTSTSSSSDGAGHVLRHARTHLIGFFTSTDTSVHPGVVALIVLVLVGGSAFAVFAWWRSNKHTASAMVPSGATPQLEMLPTSSRSGGGGGGGHSGTPLLASSRGGGAGAKPPLMGGASGKGKLGVLKKGHGAGGGHFELLGSEDV